MQRHQPRSLGLLLAVSLATQPLLQSNARAQTAYLGTSLGSARLDVERHIRSRLSDPDALERIEKETRFRILFSELPATARFLFERDVLVAAVVLVDHDVKAAAPERASQIESINKVAKELQGRVVSTGYVYLAQGEKRISVFADAFQQCFQRGTTFMAITYGRVLRPAQVVPAARAFHEKYQGFISAFAIEWIDLTANPTRLEATLGSNAVFYGSAECEAEYKRLSK